MFEVWQTAGIRFLVLRNYAELPRQLDNDLDILVAPPEIARAEKLLVSTARAHGYTFINRAELSPVSLFFSHETSREQVHIDLFKSLKWRGFDLLEAETVLAARLERGPFFIPDPVHEAVLNLLNRLLYQGYVKEDYRSDILEVFTNEPERTQVTLARVLGAEAAQQLTAMIRARSWAEVEAKANEWRRSLATHQLARFPLRSATAIWSDGVRLTKRFLEPPGLMVVLLGPDGSGKSSVAAGVMERLSTSFKPDKSRYIHWKPSVLKPRASRTTPVTDPHGEPPRPLPVALGYFLFHVTDFALGSLLKLRPLLFRNGLVLVDRYYHDFFVDQRRYRLDLPEGIVSGMFRPVKKPDLVICLDAPPDVLQRRKQEVAFAETGRQQRGYRELTRSLPNGYIVDASQPLEEVIKDAEGVIVRYLAKRAAERY